MYNTITVVQLEGVLREATERLILVNFSVEYSGQSRMLEEVLSELEGGYQGQIDFYRVVVDQALGYVAQLGIYELPAILVYAQNDLIFSTYGLQSKSHLRTTLDQLVEE